MRSRVAAWLCSIAVAGCAAQPNRIVPTQTSVFNYQPLDCATLTTEIARIDKALLELNGLQRKAATADAVWVTVGTLLFWPAYFALIATDDHETEIARLKGEQSAMIDVRTARPCSGN